MIASARAQAQSQLDTAQSAASAYFTESQSKAAAMLIAATNESNRVLELAKRKLSEGEEPEPIVVGMPAVIPPLADGENAGDILTEHGIEEDLTFETIELPEEAPLPEFTPEKSAPQTVPTEDPESDAARKVIDGYSPEAFIEAHPFTDTYADENRGIAPFEEIDSGLTEDLILSPEPMVYDAPQTSVDAEGALRETAGEAEEILAEAKGKIDALAKEGLPAADDGEAAGGDALSGTEAADETVAADAPDGSEEIGRAHV